VTIQLKTDQRLVNTTLLEGQRITRQMAVKIKGTPTGYIWEDDVTHIYTDDRYAHTRTRTSTKETDHAERRQISKGGRRLLKKRR
jgi:hypothetical protein